MYNIQIVEHDPEGDGQTALYLNGKLHEQGDDYHNKISVWIEGFIKGIEITGQTPVVSHFRTMKEGSKKASDFYNFPLEFNKRWKPL